MDEMLSFLRSSWQSFLELLKRFIPQLFAMILVVVAGFVIAKIAAFLVRRVLRLIRFDSLLEKTGTAALLKQANAPPAESVACKAVFWMVWLAFLLSGMHALGITGADALAADVVRLFPKLLVAIVIAVVGIALSNFLWRATLLAAVNARLSSARLMGGLVRVVMLVATASMALEQLDIARQIIHSAFVVAFGAAMLAGAIAFGFGGRHHARRFLDEKLSRKDEEPGKGKVEPPHL